MQITIEDFKEPDKHPFGMLEGYGFIHTCEEEEFLVFLLRKCIEQRSFDPVQCKYSHDALLRAGLLSSTSEKSYALTEQAIRMLYAHFGK